MNGFKQQSFRVFKIGYVKDRWSVYVGHRGLLMSGVKRRFPGAPDQSERVWKKLTGSGSTNLPSSQAYFQVIANGHNGLGKCVFLLTDSNRYMFNCPENVSRNIRILSNFRLNKLQDVFVTRNIWANIGGLPGLSLSLKQAFVQEITIHGPSNMDGIFRATNCTYDGTPPVNIVQKHYSLDNFEDDTLLVRYVPLFGKRKASRALALNENTEETKEVSVAYICTLKPRPGRMNVSECVKLGVPVGPLLGQLQKGIEVTLNDGRVVKPEQVLHRPDPTPTFALVDVEDENFLKSLLSAKQFRPYFHREDNSNQRLDLLIHFTNAKLFENESYQRWMKGFGPGTQHLVLNELTQEYCTNAGVFAQQAQLNHMNGDIFKLLSCHKNLPASVDADLSASVVLAEPHLTYHLRPLKKFVRQDNAELIQDINTHVKMLYEQENFQSTFDHYKARLKELESENPDKVPEQYPEVVFLGTASAVQTKYRGVTAILVHLSRYKSILMDCGEGTLHQLQQYYDADELPAVLTNVKMIFVSHLHADHNLGLFTLLKRRKEAFDQLDMNFEPVHLIGPAELFKIQHIYSQLIDDIMPLARRLPSNGENETTLSGLDEIRRKLDLSSLMLIKVSHPKSAFGLIFRLRDGFKVVFSGDTVPCPRLIAKGQDADLLIHEASLDDSRAADAKLKCHCTMSQAYDVSKQMGAKFTIFTHFSGRYIQLPLFDSSMLENKNIFFAFDFTRFTPALTASLANLVPLLKAAFNRHYEEALLKKELYEFRLMREREEKVRQMKLKQKLALHG